MAQNSCLHRNEMRENHRTNNSEGKAPFLIGVAGGTASGKSTVCKRIMEKLGQVDVDQKQRQVVTISQDSFYRILTAEEKAKAQKGLYNFDHPDAFDNDLILQTLRDILAGKKCEIPEYDYKTNSRCEDKFITIYPADVVLFEGILVFYFPEIRELFHMKLFVDTDSDTRLARRVPRDINERGRDLEQVLNQYMNFVKPAFEEFCSPTKKYADVIIPRGADNTVAIDLIVHHIWDILHGVVNRRWASSSSSSENLSRYLNQSFSLCINAYYKTGGECESVSTRLGTHVTYFGEIIDVAIDLIVQHIRDIRINRRVPSSSTLNIKKTQTTDGYFTRPH